MTQFSVQGDHLHLLVESEGKHKLARGMQGLMIRIAKALNGFWHRIGSVFADRYFSLAVTKRKQAWRTLRYVLQNGRKHGAWRAKDQPDPFSSGRWFLRWERGERIRRPLRSSPVESSRYFDLWYLDPLGLDELPGPQLFESSETIESLLALAKP